MAMLSIDSIKHFWAWFEKNETRLFMQCETETVWQEIDLELSRVSPEIAWEFGPASDGRMYFAVSPDLRDSLLSMAHAIVADAYKSTRWEFLVGRQRRPWSDLLFIADEKWSSQGIQPNLKEWRHIVYRIQDSSKFDIVFETGASTTLNEDDLDEIATMLAINLLGEITVMEKVEMIEVLAHFEEKSEAKAKPAAWLAYAFGMTPL
jgi:hypothetical protein